MNNAELHELTMAIKHGKEPWNLFAASALQGLAGRLPREKGESDNAYCVRLAGGAAQVADAMEAQRKARIRKGGDSG